MGNFTKEVIVAHVNENGDKLIQLTKITNSSAHLFEMDSNGKLVIGLKCFFDVMEGISEKNDWVREQLKIDVVRNKSIQSNSHDQLMFVICSSDQDVISHSYKKLIKLAQAFARNDESISSYFSETTASQEKYHNLIKWVLNQDVDRIVWANYEALCINDFDTIGQFMKLYIETISLLDEFSLFEMYGANHDDFEYNSTLNNQKRIILF